MPQFSPTTFAHISLNGAHRLWDEVPEAMAEAVEHVEHLLEQTLDGYDAELCATQRGEPLVKFARAEQAVEWTFALKRALVEAEWPEALLAHRDAAVVLDDSHKLVWRGPRVAVGLATGEPVRRCNWRTGQLEYVGAVVEQVSRLAECAPPAGVAANLELVDVVGSLRLEALGIGAREVRSDEPGHELPYFELHALDADARGHALASAQLAPQTNLPTYRSRFLGRTRQLAELAALCEQAPCWVSLVGTAGVGKTRLAVEFAQQWMREPLAHRREAWFCEIPDASSLEEALFGIARVIGVQLPPEQGAEPIIERLADSLAARQAVLLVLDNAEHLADGLGEVIARLVARSDDLIVLMTSRRSGGHRAERVVELEALGNRSARVLLEDRLASPPGVQMHFGPRDRQALCEIVERCGELPLAIELVAASGRRLSPQKLLRAWRQDEEATPVGRLEQAIERTWSMLAPWEQTTLLQCAVFVGGLTVEAAEAVVDLIAHPGAPPVSDVLEDLHAHSLLHSRAGGKSTEQTRFSMYEPVRVFCHRRLDEATHQDARRRHARHFLRWGESAAAGLEGPEESNWIARLTLELPNLESAYEHASEEQPQAAVRLVAVLRELDWRVGPLGGQRERAETAVTLAESDGRPEVVAEAYLVRAQTRMWLHQYEGADADFARAHALVAELDNVRLEARALIGRTFAASHRGQYRRALDFSEEALAMTRRSGTLDEISALGWTALPLSALGRKDEAISRLHDALVLARQRANPGMLARVLSTLGTVLGGHPEHNEGRRHLTEALALFRAQGDRRQVTVTLYELARVCGSETDHEREERYYEQALQASASIGESQYLALILQGRARSRFSRGLYVSAEADLVRALASLQTDAHLNLNVWIWAYMAACYAALDRIAEAERFFEKARVALEDTDARTLSVLLEVLRGFEAAARARRAFAGGDQDTAEALLDEAYACCERPHADDVPHVNEAHAVARSLRAALDAQVEQGLLPAHAATARRILEVGPNARWFRIDGHERVDISRRGALRKILDALVTRRLEAPETPLSVDDVVAAGWPDEVLTPESGARRVYSTINRMRDLGLEELLQTVDEGYLIDPAVTAVRARRTE